MGNLYTRVIDGTEFKNLLNRNSPQHIDSTFDVASTLHFKDNLKTGTINGEDFRQAASVHEQVTIQTPVLLNEGKVGQVRLGKHVKINGHDLGEIISSPKRTRHIYSTENGQPIHVTGLTTASALYTNSIFQLPVVDIEKKLWRTNYLNVVPNSLFLQGRNVTVVNKFETTTTNGMHIPQDLILLDANQVIESPIHFTGPVIVRGNVDMDTGVKMNKLDFSEISKFIVRPDFHGKIEGNKIFTKPLVTGLGIKVQEVNGVILERDVVMLNAYGREFPQIMNEHVTFGSLKVKAMEVDCDVQVMGTTNDHNLKQVVATTAYKNEDLKIYTDLVFEEPLESKDFLNPK